MNKEELISAISIEFGLSKELSEKVINSMFSAIAQSLKKNKILKLQKFGKFKIVSEKDGSDKNASIKYYPSKKIAARVNGNFDNLRKVKLKLESEAGKLESKDPETVRVLKDTSISIEKSIDEGIEITKEEVERVLISEDLIKLHDEITKKGKDEPDKSGLWR
jgi:nucleoid DNA-binding protein